MRSNGRAVEVRAGYRLHLGFYRFYDHPYVYGSIGISIEEPYISVFIRSGQGLQIKCKTKLCEGLVETVAKLLKVNDVDIDVDGFIKHHVGLGSRTRVLLTTYSALTHYLGVEFSPAHIANLLGRKISGVGIYSFLYGNLVVDSGLKVGDESLSYPRLLHLYEVPEDWYLIVVLPEGLSGLSEEEEVGIIKEVDVFPKQEALYKEFVGLLTSLSLKDFNNFTKALSKIQQLTGEYFSKYQGGIFAHDLNDDLAKHLEREGARGVGQSSWGPTIYGFVDNYVKALSVRTSLLSYAEKRGLEIRCWVTNASKFGHQVFIHKVS
ncbi:MAG: hypothetical protein N3G48_00080 [Sulfolobales archaeon]|nr:hypothetical protein [Sulfolobales archaeon]